MASSGNDSSARRVKELVSEVKKLRGWSASDSSVGDRLVDALNELTAVRLEARQYGAAAEDAPDALTRAHRLVAEHGAVGPFTPVDDGVRFVTATVQLAVTQAGIGQVAAAGQMAQAVRGWMALLPQVDLTAHVGARTAAWALLVQAQALLEAGEIADAWAYADAAVARAVEGGLDAPVLVDAWLASGDARWVAGQVAASLEATRAAVAASEGAARPLLEGGIPVAGPLAARTILPWVRACSDLADRLLASGDADAGVAERQTLVAALTMGFGVGPAVQDALARASADLADDLLARGDDAGALDAATRAAEAAGRLASTGESGAHLGAQFAAGTALARTLVRQGDAEGAAEAVASLLDRHASLRRPPGFEAQVALATLVRADAERARGHEASAEESLRAFHALVSGLLDDAPAGRRLWGQAPAEVFARARARGAWLAADQPTAAPSALSDAEAWAAATAPVARANAAHPADDTSGADAVPAPEDPAPSAIAGVEAAEASRDAEPNEGAAPPVDTPPPADAEPSPDAEPPVDTVPALAAAHRAALDSGDRRATLAAAEALTEALRPLALADPGQWGRDFVTALDGLGEARFKAGDWWGSRAPKKEAKQFARAWGL